MEVEGKYLLREEGKSYAKSSFSSIEELLSFVYERGIIIEQGYLNDDIRDIILEILGVKPGFDPVESRIRKEGSEYYLTLKGDGTSEREEFNTPISKDIFNAYWDFTFGQRVSKIRFKIPYQGYTAEVDFYTDRDLIVAEIEVKDKSHDSKYKNSRLAK
jgi:CYTH domain-containing protein